MDITTIIAVILFFLSLVVEYFVVKRKNIPHSYEKHDLFNNLLIGFFDFVFKVVLVKGTILASFAYFHQYALFDIGNQWWAWVILFFLNDLLFYFFHRWSHEIRILWASHSVHHSSELYNMSTSMRGSFLIVLYRFVLWFPLAAIGFAPEQILLMDSIAFFYQFPIHTNTMRSWGILEYVFNTPSHHRVHHGSNPQYLDKNYGAVLIIWDRLFGTFAQEKEEVVFGLTENIKTQNIIKIVFFEWVAMFRDLFRSRTAEDVFQNLLGRPGWNKKKERERELAPGEVSK
ncbi:MAG: sterol desaturase family protein [Lewinellaceae bacterium]|nr:sterol desaturase family protein [Lewinellaceae bacterium]